MGYRREDGGDAGRLADRLVDRFGVERVFIDVDAIEPGMDYVEALTRAVGACDVLVAVIGPDWLTAADKQAGASMTLTTGCGLRSGWLWLGACG